MTAFGQYSDDDSASTLKERDHKDATDLVVSASVTSKWAKGTGGPSGDEAQNLVTDVAHTLTGEGFDASEDGTGRGTPIVPQTFILEPESGQGADLTARAADTSNALTVTEYVRSTDRGLRVVEPRVFRKSRRPRSTVDDETWVDDGQANTLNVFDQGETRTTHAVVGPEYGVRRLTPVECERLQAFPDGWTEPAGSDSARYRALGNAVTVSTVGWILGRMRDVT